MFKEVNDLENTIVKKTNKYVYFSNGTHMSYSDFHRLKQDNRHEYALIHAKEYKDSVRVLVKTLDEQKELERMYQQACQTNQALEIEIAMMQPDTHDWKKSFEKERNAHDKTTQKLNDAARKMYSQLSELPILKDYQNDKGLKFIIQQNYKTKEYRLCFDPYEMCPNFHSSLSEIFREVDWGTVNGGWLKAIENTVTLYSKSGDYGIYDDQIAIQAAKVIFPSKEIRSFAGIEWSNI